jgi:hypothetical protein
MDLLSAFERMFFGERNGHEVVEKLLSRAPIDVILRLAQLNYRLRTIVQNFQLLHWDYNAFLAQWFHDPISFRTRMGECDAIISGWYVLQFLGHSMLVGERHDVDLEIVLRLDGVRKMGQELQTQGFDYVHWNRASSTLFDMQVKALARKFVSRQRSYPGPYQQRPRIIQCYQFERTISDSKNGLSHRQGIKLVVVSVNPIAHVIDTSKASEWYQ